MVRADDEGRRASRVEDQRAAEGCAARLDVLVAREIPAIKLAADDVARPGLHPVVARHQLLGDNLHAIGTGHHQPVMRRICHRVAQVDHAARVDARQVQLDALLLHVFRRSARHDVRQPLGHDDDSGAVGAERHDRVIHRQDVLLGPRVRDERLAEIQVFAHERGHHAVGQRDQPLQAVRRRVVFQRRQHLAEVVGHVRVDEIGSRRGALLDEKQVGAAAAGLRPVETLLGDVAAGWRRLDARQRARLPALPARDVGERGRLRFLAERGDEGVDVGDAGDIAGARASHSERGRGGRHRHGQVIGGAVDDHLRLAVAHVVEAVLGHRAGRGVHHARPRHPRAVVLVDGLGVVDANGRDETRLPRRRQATIVKAHVHRPLRGRVCQQPGQRSRHLARVGSQLQRRHVVIALSPRIVQCGTYVQLKRAVAPAPGFPDAQVA
ncbi:hypothetical protein F1_00069 [Ralstonia phage Heva]|uniref:Uncharacterized protein n=1 Tax=Ralstonia phage Heva TaxID=2759730 RepID=A0A7G5BAV9_9CAUD|nr:hypothetical protein KMC48_gp21 [Ralstonia phage Heva]QMV33432.1 hypothetical protein F1_00069 [Ralstonia phage Heva]